jgi:hypothetical protein
MSCSVLRVRFARGDTHMLLGVVWLVWCGILSALYLGERGARRTTPRLVRYPGAGGQRRRRCSDALVTSVSKTVSGDNPSALRSLLRSRDVVLRGLSATLNVAGTGKALHRPQPASTMSDSKFIKFVKYKWEEK